MDSTSANAPSDATTKASTRIAASALRTRWVVRLPIYLFRLRLGWIFGRRLLLLEHYGRVTGQRRYVVLEVVDWKPGVYYVVSGFGQRSDWVRNILANQRVQVTVGSGHPRPGFARRVEPDIAASVLATYADKRPHAWRELSLLIEQLNGTPSVQPRDMVTVAITLERAPE